MQVHWTSVTSRFPNHDSVLELSSSDQLTENNVTAHVELHSGRSSAGSGSNKKPLLDGISEEGAEDKVSPLASVGKSSFDARSKDGDQQMSPLSSADTTVDHSKRISALINKTNATSAALQDSLTKVLSRELETVPEVSVTSSSPALDGAQDWQVDSRRPSTDSRSMLDMGSRRMSTASGRPSTASEALSLYELESLYKPKVKVGPRPATAARPASKTSTSAALPSGLRASASRTPSLRPKSRDSNYSAYRAFPPPPIPESSPMDFVQRPRSSGQSVKSLPASLPKSPGMTREKQRLMKFREMYKEKENRRVRDMTRALDGSPADVMAPKIDSPIPQSMEAEKVDLGVAASSPAESTLDPRLSVISEASTARRTLTATTSMIAEIPEESPEMASQTSKEIVSVAVAELTAAHKTPEDVVTAQQASVKPRSSIDSSGFPSSSPTSLVDSSITSSTRATSFTDDSDRESTKEDEDDRRKTVVQTPSQVNHEDEESQSSTPTAAPKTEKRTSADERERRRAAVAPITIPEHHDVSETESLTHDDDLMDELDSAEVQEAFSVSVTKSPITPFFQRRPSSAHSPNSPMSIMLGGTSTPPPLPSSSYFDKARSSSGANTPAQTDVRVGKLVRTMSGSLLKDQVAAATPQQKNEHDLEKAGSKEVDSKNYQEQGAVSGDYRATLTPEIRRTSAQPAESTTPQTDASWKSSPLTNLSVNKPTRKKSSRRSSAMKALSSRGKSPSASHSLSSDMLSPNSDSDSLSVHKRRNLGTGVASKIADLQRQFSRGPTATSPSAGPTSRQSSIVSVRATSVADPAEATPPRSAHSHLRDEHLFRGRAMSKGSMRSFESRDTRMSTPPRNGSIGKLDSKRFTTFANPALEVSTKPDTIQVKATIIRTDRDATEFGLQQPPMESDHARVEPHYAHPRTSIIVEEPRSPGRTSIDTNGMHRRARSSISSAFGMMGIRSDSPRRSNKAPESPVVSDGRRSARASLDMSGSIRSLRRRASASMSRSPSVSRGDSYTRDASLQGRYSPLPPTPRTSVSVNSAPHFSRSMSSSSLESSATTEYDGDVQQRKRKSSRASRLMKRMSSSMSSMLHSGGGHENSSSNLSSNAVHTVEEEKWVGADLGQMNVQFPDTLVGLLPVSYGEILLMRNSFGNVVTLRLIRKVILSFLTTRRGEVISWSAGIILTSSINLLRLIWRGWRCRTALCLISERTVGRSRLLRIAVLGRAVC